jgi:hypothetical protein
MVDMAAMEGIADTEVAIVTPSPWAETVCNPLRKKGPVINTDALGFSF